LSDSAGPSVEDRDLQELFLEFNALGASCVSTSRSITLVHEGSIYFDDKMTLPFFNVDGSSLPPSPLLVLLFRRSCSMSAPIGMGKARLPGTRLPTSPNSHGVDLLSSTGAVVGQVWLSYTFHSIPSKWVEDAGIRDGQQGSRVCTLRAHIVAGAQFAFEVNEGSSTKAKGSKSGLNIKWAVGCPDDPTQLLCEFTEPLLGPWDGSGTRPLHAVFEFSLRLGDLDRFNGILQFESGANNEVKAELSTPITTLLDGGSRGTWYESNVPGFEDVGSGHVWISVLILEEQQRSAVSTTAHLPASVAEQQNDRLKLFIHVLDVSGLVPEKKTNDPAYYLTVRISCIGTKSQRFSTAPTVSTGNLEWNEHLEATVDPRATSFEHTVIHFELCDANSGDRKDRMLAAFHMSFDTFYSKLHEKGNEFIKKVFRLKYVKPAMSGGEGCAKVRLSILAVMEVDLVNASKKVKAFQKRSLTASPHKGGPGKPPTTRRQAQDMWSPKHTSRSEHTVFSTGSDMDFGGRKLTPVAVFEGAALTYGNALTRLDLFEICKHHFPGFSQDIENKAKSPAVLAVDQLLAKDDDPFGAGKLPFHQFATWWNEYSPSFLPDYTSIKRSPSPSFLSQGDTVNDTEKLRKTESLQSKFASTYTLNTASTRQSRVTEDVEMLTWQLELVQNDLRNLTEATDVAEKLDAAQTASIVKSLLRNHDSLVSAAQQFEEELRKYKESFPADLERVFANTNSSLSSAMSEQENASRKIYLLFKALKGVQGKISSVAQRITVLQDAAERQTAQAERHQQKNRSADWDWA